MQTNGAPDSGKKKGNIMKCYTQLAEHERYLISELMQLGLSHRAVALRLGRAPSTIGRELKRNKTTHDGSYRPSKAERYAIARRRRSRRGVKFKPKEYEVVRRYLKKKWSPDQISKTLRETGELDMSHESIYKYIKRDKRAGGDLFRHCRILPKNGRKRRGSQDSRGVLAGKRHISERPKEVEGRRRRGHWEGDTVVGKDLRHCLLTLVERKTGYAIIKKLRTRSTAEANRALREIMKEHGHMIKTITFDNGTEFHSYKEIENEFPVKIYFATPYHSWERGSNEHLNGLIRQYVPKGTCMKDLTQAQCDRIAHSLNTRPRKRHGYKTPEVMYGRP
jgi:transposase, IS30 family